MHSQPHHCLRRGCGLASRFERFLFKKRLPLRPASKIFSPTKTCAGVLLEIHPSMRPEDSAVPREGERCFISILSDVWTGGRPFRPERSSVGYAFTKHVSDFLRSPASCSHCSCAYVLHFFLLAYTVVGWKRRQPAAASST